MATIKIKYSDITDTPVSLVEGELAYSRKSDKLFLGVDSGENIVELNTVAEPIDGEQLVDYLSDTQLYRGESVVGTLSSDASWRIRWIIISADGSSALTRYADGTDDFDNVWDDRATLTYS